MYLNVFYFYTHLAIDPNVILVKLIFILTKPPNLTNSITSQFSVSSSLYVVFFGLFWRCGSEGVDVIAQGDHTEGRCFD